MINDNTAQWRLKKITNVTNNFDGYWQAGEAVEVGTLRFPRGQENTGYILECVEAGTTGSTQPEIIINSNEVANYAEVGRVGQVRVIFNLAEKDVDEVMAMGITYSRLTYPELWKWAGKRAGLIISEEEWQAKFAETNGKFVPYYSSGDGSSTFRTPLLGAYLKGAETAGDVGGYKEAGLPNLEGQNTLGWANVHDGVLNNGGIVNGVFDGTNRVHLYGAKTYLGGASGAINENLPYGVAFDASAYNPIYGNSDTVTPETMVGIWVIKAVGVVVDSGNTDIAQCLTATEQVQERVSVVEDWTKDSSNYSSMPSTQRISVSLESDSDSNCFWLKYNAPCDGWLSCAFTGLGLEISNGMWAETRYTSSEKWLVATIPVRKGQVPLVRFCPENPSDATVIFNYAQSEV